MDKLFSRRSQYKYYRTRKAGSDKRFLVGDESLHITFLFLLIISSIAARNSIALNTYKRSEPLTKYEDRSVGINMCLGTKLALGVPSCSRGH